MNKSNSDVLVASHYWFVTDDCQSRFKVPVAIVRDKVGFELRIGASVSVPFLSEAELLRILPPYSGENELGYEEARATLVQGLHGAIRSGRV